MRKRWNILIVPNTSEAAYTLNVTEKALKLGAIATAILFLISVVLCGAWIHVWKKDAIDQMEALEGNLRGCELELSSLNRQFARLVVLEEKLRGIAGLEPRQPAVLESELGGQGGRRISEMALLGPDHEAVEYHSYWTDMMPAGVLLQEITTMEGGFTEILEAFEKEQERLSSIPSINPVLSPDAWISSGYGYRRDPISGDRRFHEGIDIVAPRKTPIIAPADGVVTFSGWRDGIGRAIEIRHGYGFRTTYGHNQKLMAKKGDQVKRGDIIALLGSSGRSTGPHLHYEIQLNGKLVNPYQYVIE